MMFICVEMYVCMYLVFETNTMCYVSFIKEKGSHRITYHLCSGLIFSGKYILTQKLHPSRLMTWPNTLQIYPPLRILKRLKQTTTLLSEGEESSAAAAQE